ncbi:putative pectate lyase 1 [Artemisia annua]|uniref:Putative pectate lyase 1 n=1 Tax=Artemisia annua TaxID=35608 RepID=A0A2U1LGZ5_ARTAN|nr:putative pectate lyase 1 [Artemisia annua]
MSSRSIHVYIQEHVVAVMPHLKDNIWKAFYSEVMIKKKFPNCCLDVVVAEQHAVTFATGLAAEERRKLGYFSCGTGNPIDECWRYDPNWQRNRKRLADYGIGLGKNAIRGRDPNQQIQHAPPQQHPIQVQPSTGSMPPGMPPQSSQSYAGRPAMLNQGGQQQQFPQSSGPA